MKINKISKIWLGGIAAFVVTVATLVVVAPSVGALPGQVDGTVYADQNNNGIRDGGEPGLEGILVRWGTGGTAPQAITDTNGYYEFTGVSGTRTVEVLAGWFRSQCNSLNCAAGPGADNDFAVDNQFIQQPSVNGTVGATLNAGLIPDWDGQGTYATYPTNGSVVTGTPTDIATRLSYGTGCSAGTGAERLCNPGMRPRFRVAFFNQGTETISNPVVALQLPVGHRIDDTSWFDNNQAIPTANTISILKPFDDTLGYGVYQLNGTIPPGASSTMFFDMDVLVTAIGSPQPYATDDPRDKQMVAQIMGMDQTGDWDSQFCLESGQSWGYGTCSLSQLGDHDATLAADHTDGSTWNVSGASVPRVDSMTVTASISDPTIPIHACSNGPSVSAVTANLQVTNTSTGDTPLRNVEIVADVPTGLTFDLADNPGWFVGGDGKPHTFVNLHMLPGASISVPLYLQIASDITVNGMATLTVAGNITAYDTAQVDASRQFLPGAMAGTLSSSDNVEVTSDGCPVVSDDTTTLASTGMNLPAAVMTGALLCSIGLIIAIARRRKEA